MLPTKEEQENKIIEIIKTSSELWNSKITEEEYNSTVFDIINNEYSFIIVAKEYAKWYAEQVIKHCAEVAKHIE
jgi:hypothetical protein